MEIKYAQLPKISAGEYLRILKLRNAKFTEADGYYYQVGTIKGTHGWILNISVIRSELHNTLEKIVPILLKRKVPFRMAKSPTDAERILNGSLGYGLIGKVLRIYPDNTSNAVALARLLLELTAGLDGPVVPTDAHLGASVYTEYVKYHVAASNVPFQITNGIDWPFSSIKNPNSARRKRVLGNRYLIQKEIRSKPKGSVYKCLLFKGLTIKTVVVKEAKRGMCDELDRKLSQRLKWQWHVLSQLVGHVKVPRPFEIFDEMGDTYLAMELITGNTLQLELNEIYRTGSWRTLTTANKSKILSFLIDALQIVRELHARGYVHRDLTPENFVISNGRLVLIDLELSYNYENGEPTPPFRLGTVGFMSPEQIATQTPTISEDIYSIGALMIALFTNISPGKFNLENERDLAEKLEFFFGDQQVIYLIISCLTKVPEARPRLSKIIEIILELRSKIRSTVSEPTKISLDLSHTVEKVKFTIDSALRSLSNSVMAEPGMPWHTIPYDLIREIGNKQVAHSYEPGFYGGTAGALYAISSAKEAGFKINLPLQQTYDRNFRFLKERIKSQNPNSPSGLDQGVAGGIIAIVSGITSGLLKPTSEITALIKMCLEPSTEEIGILNGAAGRGLAILYALRHLELDFAKNDLDKDIKRMVTSQRSDGSWLMNNEKVHGIKGIAGVLLFLITYVEHFPNASLMPCIVKGLSYLKRQGFQSKGKSLWAASNKSRIAESGFEGGFAGISYMFLQAYRLIPSKNLLHIAERSLFNYPTQPLVPDATWANGVSGLGYTYLTAHKITGKQEWMDRLLWIVTLLCNSTYRNNDGTSYWIGNVNQIPSADLRGGCSGPLVFLLEFLNSYNQQEAKPTL